MSKYIKVDDLQSYCDNQKDHTITPNEFQRMNQIEFCWHTGTPTEEGCFYALQCKNRIHPEPYYGVVVKGKFSAINYDGDLMPLPPDLVAWQKITPYVEANPSEEKK